VSALEPLHLGWRVQGVPPNATLVTPLAARRDDFELKQCALECACMLVTAGWQAVRVAQRFRDGLGDEWDETVWEQPQ
jgi:hypothetical protein